MVALDMNSSSVSSENRTARQRRQAKAKPPLDAVTLRDLALSYVARFATTGAKLEAYLARKLRERGGAEDDEGRAVEVDIPALVARLIHLGYVDDNAYAQSKSRDLTARGYGRRRVEQALWAAGVEEELRAAHEPRASESRLAAVLLARKRGFGPFGQRIDRAAAPDQQRAAKEKQIAAMLRAGHDFATARFITDAATPEDIAAWLEEGDPDAARGWEEDGSC
jgi:regulatory protein